MTGRGRCCTTRGFPVCPPKDRVQTAGGAGQWPSELRPHPHSRCGPRSATRRLESRDRARYPTPCLAFNRSPIVPTGVGTQWGRGPELALVVWASPVTLRGHGPSWPFISFSSDREFLKMPVIDTARENASGNAKPKEEGFHCVIVFSCLTQFTRPVATLVLTILAGFFFPPVFSVFFLHTSK